MKSYTNVYIDNDVLYNMFFDRLNFWIKNTDSEEFKTFMEYYENIIYEGYFEGAELDINLIVDDDYINNLSYYATRKDAEVDFDHEYIDDNIAYECKSGIILNACL